MKNYLIGFLLGIACVILVASKVAKFDPAISTAEARQIDGFYIFTDSTPIMPYDSLGTVEIGFLTGTQYELIRGNLIKRARSRYPDANGLIMQLDKKGVDKCKVIRFK